MCVCCTTQTLGGAETAESVTKLWASVAASSPRPSSASAAGKKKVQHRRSHTTALSKPQAHAPPWAVTPLQRAGKPEMAFEVCEVASVCVIEWEAQL
jgi:hypothetical protein